MAQARKFGMMWCRWFEDPDFLDRSPEQRWMYVFLRGQSDLTKAGTIIVRIELWAEGTGFPPDTVRQLLEQLEAEGYVAIDWRKMELLVCGFIYDDEIYLEPYKLRNVCDVARAIKSTGLKSLLYAEAKAVMAELTGPSADRKGAAASARVCEEMIYALEPFANLRVASRMPFGVPAAPADMPIGPRATTRPAANREGAERAPEGSGDPFRDPTEDPAERVSTTGQSGQKRVSVGSVEGSQCQITQDTKHLTPKIKTLSAPGGADPQGGDPALFDGNPLTVVPPPRELGVRDVVGAYVDGATKGQLPEPSDALKARVGKAARRLHIKDHVPIADLMVHAENMGVAGWDDLDRQIQIDAARARDTRTSRAPAAGQSGGGGRWQVPDMTPAEMAAICDE